MLEIKKFNQKMCDLITLKMSAQLPEEEDYSSYLDHDFSDLLVRRSFDKKIMREFGCFFTGANLAKHLLKDLEKNRIPHYIFLDATCGLGNLLVEACKFLPIKEGIKETLELWGQKLVGYDIFEEFIKGAKLRIIFEALRRGAKSDCSLEMCLSLLSRIKCGSVMTLDAFEIKDITHAILNPPFSSWSSPLNYYWKKGKINSAGIIMDHLIRLFHKGTTIYAILPDVLRSGSRYRDFRNFIEKNIDGKIEIWGKFSAKTDIDVFLLKGKKSEVASSICWKTNDSAHSTLEEHFDISIGPLVAYREPEVGKNVLYLHQKNAPTGNVINNIFERRKFQGRLTQPPFVVIKRTSSPRDKLRASATIINCSEPVAVENHLIILSPKDNSLKKCNELLEILQSQDTTDYLNARIRLRHLTISAIKSIPYK